MTNDEIAEIETRVKTGWFKSEDHALLLAEVSELKAQRDELAAALRVIAKDVHVDGHSEIARAALVKNTGKTNV
jgi:hypothetical protein